MIWAFLAWLQAGLLPGWLTLSVSRYKSGSLVEATVIAFALSLLLNYLFAYFTATVGAYGHEAVLALLAVECVALCIIIARSERIGSLSVLMPSGRGLRDVALFILAAILMGATVLWALSSSATIAAFEAWDAAFSWNRLARTWYAGEVPPQTNMYPQLIPANWSMMYLIAGSPAFEFAPLALMPWFGVGILAMFFDLGMQRRRQEYFVGLLFCGAGAWWLRGTLFAPAHGAFGGYVDVPVTFMALVPLYVLMLRGRGGLESRSQLLLVVALASAAAVTKFTGIFSLLAVAVLVLRGDIRARQTPTVIAGRLLVVAAGATVVAGSWWLPKVMDFATGRDATGSGEIAAAVASGGGITFAQRIEYISALTPGGWVALLGILALLSAALVRRSTRWVSLGLVVPYTLAWAIFLSYSLRNWLPMLPLLAYLAAMVIGDVASRFYGEDAMGLRMVERRLDLGPAGWGALGAVGVAVIVGVGLIYPDERLASAVVEAKKRVGDERLNQMVYAALSGQRGGSVLTDYAYLTLLPELGGAAADGIEVAYIGTSQLRAEDLAKHRWLLLSERAADSTGLSSGGRQQGAVFAAVFRKMADMEAGYGEPVRLTLYRRVVTE